MSDPNFERSLRAAARRGRPGGVHPDAALLASYVDRGLNDAERAELEAHVADCADCMERLALLGSVNVPDEPDAASIEWSPRSLLSRWGWLVPVATVVVLIAVWEHQPSTTPPVLAPQEKPAVVIPVPSAQDAANQPATEARKESDRPAGTGVQNEEAQKLPGRRLAQAAKAKDAAAPQMQARARDASPQFGASAPTAAPQDALTALQDKKPLDAGPPVPAAPPAQAESAAAVAGRADQGKRQSEVGLNIKAMPESVAQGALLKSEVQGPVVLASSDAVMIRRIGTRLERSTDRGVTWTLDLADAPAGLGAGACPNAGVCWVGGSQGNVLVRHPSGTWTRHVVADGRAAVSAIDASDATTATVHLSDGRSFHTSDGGSTWETAPGKR